DLKNAALQADKMPLLPQQVAEQMAALGQLFQQKAVQPLQDLSTRMEQGKDPAKAAPDVKEMQKVADRLQKELEAMRDRMQALAGAQKQLRDDAKEALSKLERDMQQQDARLSARDLEALRDFIAALRKELQNLEGKQQQLMDANRTVPDVLRPEL